MGAEQHPIIYDMHCHIAFAPDPSELARAAATQKIAALSATVLPAEYRALRESLTALPHLHAGLGLHPWWVADGRAAEDDVRLFEDLAPDASVIGEIGLDFARDRGSGPARARQIDVLERVLIACCKTPVEDRSTVCTGAADDTEFAGRHTSAPTEPANERTSTSAARSAARKVISLHAVRSADVVLDLLERTGASEQCSCIFHWFSGTSDELNRAIGMGCWFSVGTRMLASKRGRAYARAIPTPRLLVETDLPAQAGDVLDPAEWRLTLEETVTQLATIRSCDAGELTATLSSTSSMLLEKR